MKFKIILRGFYFALRFMNFKFQGFFFFWKREQKNKIHHSTPFPEVCRVPHPPENFPKFQVQLDLKKKIE